MANRRDETLRSLLKTAGLPKPDALFTDEVMREIEAADEVYASPALKSALQRHAPVMPAADFTYKVLNRARQQRPAPSYPPVISKKIWITVSAFVLAYVVTAIIMGRSSGDHTGLPYVMPMAPYIRSLMAKFGEPLSYLGLIIATVCLLLLLDHFVKKRWRARPVA